MVPRALLSFWKIIIAACIDYSWNVASFCLFFFQEGFPAKEQKVYPNWVLAVCVLLSSLPCVFIPGVALYQLGRKALK